MIIYPRSKTIKSEANWTVVFSLIFVLVFLLISILNPNSLSKKTLVEDPASTIFVAIFLPWFIIYMIGQTRKLYALSRLRGPLISISEDGIVDHFHSPEKLSWDQIKFVGCKNTMGRDNYKYFVVKPQKPNWVYWLRRLYSHPMKYKLDRLAIPKSDIPEIYDLQSEESLEYVYQDDIRSSLKKVAPKAIL